VAVSAIGWHHAYRKRQQPNTQRNLQPFYGFS